MSPQARKHHPVPAPETGQIRGEVEHRAAAAAQYNRAEQAVIGQKNWIAKLLPPPERGGLSAEAFCVQVLQLLRRSIRPGNQMTLMSAACENPESLVFAMTDCAARNLIPGEEYWFVPFRDRERGGPPVVTGMPGWKGELQQIYRSGMVEAVPCELVYAGDRFRWLPTRMRVPEHEPADVPHDAQFIRRGYAYAHLRGGGTTYPVVLGTHEVAIIESHSKAPRDFWQNPKWRDRMWRKSLLHMLYDRVPHSAAYNTALVEAFAEAADRFPALSITGSDEGSDLTAGTEGALAAASVQVPAAVPGRAERPAPPPVPATRNGNGTPPPDDAPWPGEARQPITVQSVAERAAADVPAAAADNALAAAEEDGTDWDGPVTRPTMEEPRLTAPTARRIAGFFQRAKWSGEDNETRRQAVIGVLAAGNGEPLDLTETRLTEAQGQFVAAELAAMWNEAKGLSEVFAAKLQELHDQWAALQAARAAGQDQP